MHLSYNLDKCAMDIYYFVSNKFWEPKNPTSTRGKNNEFVKYVIMTIPCFSHLFDKPSSTTRNPVIMTADNRWHAYAVCPQNTRG